MAASWEAQLEAEGLAPLGPKNALPSKFRAMTAVEIDAYTKAVERWQAWAFGVLETHVFWNDHEREVWRLYAQGVSTRRIPAMVAALASGTRHRDTMTKRFVSSGRPGSRARIQVLIARIKREHPGPPSPWTRRQLAPVRKDPA